MTKRAFAPTIVPAAPGFAIVEPIWNSETKTTDKLGFVPIVAWLITQEIDGEIVDSPMAIPISVDWAANVGVNEKTLPIKIPSGEIVFAGDCVCETDAAALAKLQNIDRIYDSAHRGPGEQ